MDSVVGKLSLTLVLNILFKKMLISKLILATALYALVKNQITDPQAIANNSITVKRADLISESSSVCDILKYEFIFCKPCQELESVISSSIENLIQQGIIFSDEVSNLIFNSC